MIKRRIYSQIKAHLPAREISVLVGSRQVGKTTLMQLLKQELDAAGKPTLFLNLDYEPDSVHFQTQSSLLNRIELEFGKNPGYVFIDEIQRKENAGLFLKGIFDQNLPWKIIVSGSGSLELKEKIQESLAGRKRLFEIMPVSFTEYIDYKSEYTYSDRIYRYIESNKDLLQTYLADYLNYGGYPRIITEPNIEEKKWLIDEIFRSYVERDIVYLLKVERPEAFINLVKLLSAHTGQLINYSTLSARLNIALPTLKKYIWYLERTFIIKSVTPFFRNFKKEITKSPVQYFIDLGLRNYAINQFGNATNIYNQGFLFQNFIFNILYEKYSRMGGRLHFWRTTDKAEVDFVIDLNDTVIPVEVKSAYLKQKTVKRSLRSFIDKYHPQTAMVINLNLDDTLKINQTRVIFMPYYRLLDENMPDARSA